MLRQSGRRFANSAFKNMRRPAMAMPQTRLLAAISNVNLLSQGERSVLLILEEMSLLSSGSEEGAS
ncbi:MAG: hypothetical protein MHM6MM_008551 [Cercozoa sp. M6MM]